MTPCVHRRRGDHAGGALIPSSWRPWAAAAVAMEVAAAVSPPPRGSAASAVRAVAAVGYAPLQPRSFCHRQRVRPWGLWGCRRAVVALPRPPTVPPLVSCTLSLGRSPDALGRQPSGDIQYASSNPRSPPRRLATSVISFPVSHSSRLPVLCRSAPPDCSPPSAACRPPTPTAGGPRTFACRRGRQRPSRTAGRGSGRRTRSLPTTSARVGAEELLLAPPRVGRRSRWVDLAAVAVCPETGGGCRLGHARGEGGDWDRLYAP